MERGEVPVARGAATPADDALLEDRVDLALQAMWAGDARQISALFGGGEESEVGPMQSSDIAVPRPENFVHLFQDAAAITAPREALLPGTRIGAYRIVRLLGHGGMGTVYEAEQDRPRRRVALKLLCAGPCADPLAVSWFEREAQALARMEHPGIARVLEAGVEGGRHFLAMELVVGLPIDRYSAAQRLATSDRVALFSRVVDAVCSAHHRGVIHRDLKPGNVLVTEDGQPRVLDFGLARMDAERMDPERVDSDAGPAGERSRLTRADTRAGTLPYMSPEQIRGDARDVDARTDVYSLGVMLFELLTGRLPLELPSARYDAERVIVEEGAPRLRSVAPDHDRDLDAIVAKALALDRRERYSSADALLADLERYREKLPVLARPPELLDGLRKLVSRHRVASGVVVGAAALLLLAFVSIVVAWARARTAEADARQQGLRAAAVGDFLSDLIERGNPNHAGADLKLRDALAQAAAELPGRADLGPSARAQLHGTIGRSLQGLGDLKEARHHLERALAIRRELHQEPHEDLAESLRDLAFLDHAESRFERSESGHRAALAMRRILFSEDNPKTLQSREELARVLHHRGQWEEARGVLEEALFFARAGGRYDAVFRVLCELGDILVESYEPRKGDERLTEALRLAQAGGDFGDVERAREALARAKLRLGESGEAKRLLQENVAAQRARLGADDPTLARSLGRLGFVCQQRDELVEGGALLLDAASAYERRFGEDAAVTLSAWGQVAWHRLKSGDVIAAVSLLGDLSRRAEVALGPDHTQAILLRRGLSRALFAAGRTEEAIWSTDAALGALIARVGADHFQVAETWCQRASFHRALDEFEAARSDYTRALSVVRSGSGAGTLLEQDSLAGLAASNARLGEHATAAAYYGELAALRWLHFGDHPQVADAWIFQAQEALVGGDRALATGAGKRARRMLDQCGVAEDRLSELARAAWGALQDAGAVE